VILFKMKRQRYAWVTIVPLSWVAICTLTAAWQKIFHDNPAIGFMAHAEKFSSALASGQILAPAKNVAQMQQIIFNDYVNTTMAALFMTLVLAMLCFSIAAIVRALADPDVTTREASVVPAE
jgi:carbon starvation protein